MLTRRILAALALAAISAGTWAQSYPVKPIRLVVPFPPGGAAEVGARLFAQPLGERLGQPVVIETRPGADGIIASDAVRKAPADGYTLYYGTATGLSFVPAVKKVPPYDPLNDFTPISLVGVFGFFVFSHADIPVQTLQDLVGWARANPGRINYGTGNATAQLATALFAAAQRIDVMHVPYKGDGPLSTDLLAGRIHFAFSTPATLAPQVKEGRVRVLATMLPTRSPLLPQAPTLPEAGFAPVPIVPWGGLLGPAKLPREVVDRLQKELAVVLASPSVKEGLGRIAFEPRSSTPEELRRLMTEQLKAYGDAARLAGITLD